ncbi:MAG: 2-isopropylmalate synthase [Planctomycetota bacterium]
MTDTTDTTSRRIVIFDTTLRDGEQSPSPGDFEAVSQIARSVRGSVICGLARCSDADIDRAWEAVRHAEQARIHVFLATSAIHREFKLKMDKDEIVRRAVAGVKRAAGYLSDVEFSPEDAVRTESDFLCEVVQAAIDAGATTVNIPDTVGYATPHHMSSVIQTLRNRVPNIDKAVISIHCHNDLGMAVANSLVAVEAGAGQIECTINGLGERAGNCSLEEVVMALRTRNDYYHAHTNVVTRRLVPTSRLVAGITGIQVQRNKAIVGQNAFAHEAGIHQDGMLKERTTYEIMKPEDVGFTKTDLVLGKHSGRAALADRANALGYHLSGEQLNAVFEQFKILADKKKYIYDADIAALVEQEIHAVAQRWTFESYQVTSASGRVPEATLTISHGGQQLSTSVASGDGPIDAIFLAIEQLTGYTVVCKDFRVHSVTVGKDAQGEVVVQVEYKNRLYRGHGVSTDSVEASAKAFLNAINRITAVANGGK